MKASLKLKLTFKLQYFKFSGGKYYEGFSSKSEIGYATDDLRPGYGIAGFQIEKITEKARLN